MRGGRFLLRPVVAWALLAGGCEPEPELAAHPASLRDDVPPAPAAAPVVTPDAGVDPNRPKTPAELLAERLEQEITAANAQQKARELEAELDKDIAALEARLSPVEVEIDE